MDRTGTFWVGTYGRGINKFSEKGIKFVHIRPNPKDPNSLNGRFIRSFYETEEGNLWVGSDGGGIEVFNKELKKIRTYKHNPNNPFSLSSNSVFSIKEGKNGDFWIGTYGGGLNHYLRNEDKFISYTHNPQDENSLSDNRIRALHVDKEGKVWIGTDGGGLNKYDVSKKKFTVYKSSPNKRNSITNNRVWGIVEDNEDNLWIGTFGGGINKFNKKNEKFELLKNQNNKVMCSNYISALYLDNNTLWVGTGGTGICKIDIKTKICKKFNTKDGLISNIVYGIIGDNEGNIWISSNRGLSKYDLKTGKFKDFDITDGLQGYEFNGGAYYKNKKGMLFFGGVNGFNMFYPQDVREDDYPPPIVITSLKIFNKEVKVGKEINGHIILKKPIFETNSIVLSYKEKVISFEFAALHYSAPSKNKYAYKMEGFDEDWNYVGNRRFASYTNLPPGHYIFRVIASNKDGVWNRKGVSLKITIVPPFWKTWWFYLLSTLFSILLIGAIIERRVYAIKKHKEKLERLVNLRTHQLKEANEKLNLLATTDGLTGIANHRKFREHLAQEWRRAKRNNTYLSVILIDVDDFKLYNDTYGHQAGDECLRKIAKVLSMHTRRPGDLAARYGGEEFIIILPEADRSGAHSVAENIRKQAMLLKIPHEKSRASEYVTISLGYASTVPSDDDGFDKLISTADEFLYKAKKNGKNQVCGWVCG